MRWDRPRRAGDDRTDDRERGRIRWDIAGRVLVSAALLAGVGWWLDGRAIAAELRTFDPRWVVAALAISAGQVVLSAWRWRFTARRLGLALPLRRAIREYYLAMFINQLVPGGIVGDVSRAWRHARTDETGPAVRAVILERLSGQIVMTIVAVVAVAALPAAVRRGLPAGWWGGVAATVAVVIGLSWVRRRARADSAFLRTVSRDVRAGLIGWTALPAQMASSMLIVGSYVVTFVIAARALGSVTPLSLLLPLVALVLIAMLIPVSIAGWGVREGAAALLWAAAGLPPADGVAISAAYGLLCLLASLPGGLIFMSLARRASP